MNDKPSLPNSDTVPIEKAIGSVLEGVGRTFRILVIYNLLGSFGVLVVSALVGNFLALKFHIKTTFFINPIIASLGVGIILFVITFIVPLVFFTNRQIREAKQLSFLDSAYDLLEIKGGRAIYKDSRGNVHNVKVPVFLSHMAGETYYKVTSQPEFAINIVFNVIVAATAFISGIAYIFNAPFTSITFAVGTLAITVVKLLLTWIIFPVLQIVAGIVIEEVYGERIKGWMKNRLKEK